jgi:hypothetical protein
MLIVKLSQSTENALIILRDLVAVETLVASLTATAPIAIAAAGGAQQLVARYGQPTGAWFWSIKSMPEILWVQMAEENQARHRANVGD